MSLARRLWALRKERPGFVVLSVLTVTLMVIWPVVDILLRGVDALHVSPYGFNDFGAYAGAVDAWTEGEPLYVQDENGGYHGSYLYPPFVVPLFYPFDAVGNFFIGGVMFGFVSLFLLWVGLETVAEEFGYRLAVWERLLLFAALFGFHPALWDFKWGQISTFLAALLCYSFYTYELGNRGVAINQAEERAGSQYLSGILTTLASSVKLFYATSGAHLLRNRRRFLGAIGAAVTLLAFSVLVFGMPVHREYIDVLTWGKGWGTEQDPPFMVQPAYYRPLYLVDQFLATLGLELPSAWVIVATVGGILGIIGLTLAARHEQAAAHPTFALGVAAVPLFAPRAYTHDLVVLLLPAIILLALELDHEDGLPWVPVLAVLLLHLHSITVSLSIHLFSRAAAVFLQPGVYGTFLLVGLAATRVAEHASAPEQLTSVLAGSQDQTKENST
jgi:alpha-1,2-mannosyltransferase